MSSIGVGIQKLAIHSQLIGLKTALKISDIIKKDSDDEIDYERLIGIDGIGETVAHQFIKGMNDRMEIICSIIEHVTITEETNPISTGHLEGKKFCITGTLSRPRKEIENLIKKAGGKIVTSVSKSLDFLISGESAGTKLDKATNFGVMVLSENDLNELIEEKTNLPKTLFDY